MKKPRFSSERTGAQGLWPSWPRGLAPRVHAPDLRGPVVRVPIDARGGTHLPVGVGHRSAVAGVPTGPTGLTAGGGLRELGPLERLALLHLRDAGVGEVDPDVGVDLTGLLRRETTVLVRSQARCDPLPLQLQQTQLGGQLGAGAGGRAADQVVLVRRHQHEGQLVVRPATGLTGLEGSVIPLTVGVEIGDEADQRESLHITLHVGGLLDRLQLHVDLGELGVALGEGRAGPLVLSHLLRAFGRIGIRRAQVDGRLSLGGGHTTGQHHQRQKKNTNRFGHGATSYLCGFRPRRLGLAGPSCLCHSNCCHEDSP